MVKHVLRAFERRVVLKHSALTRDGAFLFLFKFEFAKTFFKPLYKVKPVFMYIFLKTIIDWVT